MMCLKTLKLSLCLLITAAGVSSAANYQLDPSHTSVVFAVSHLGYSFTYGRFDKVSGSFVLSESDPSQHSFKVEIATDSIDTNDTKRDEHLRGADFFSAKQFPTITFESRSVTQIENGFALVGEMTMHGVTKSVPIELQFLGSGPGPGGGQRAGFLANFTVKRSDFGMSNMLPAIGDDITVMMSFEGVQQ
ncbi:MAG: YceI family protein [Planctomycetota bacterium]